MSSRRIVGDRQMQLIWRIGNMKACEILTTKAKMAAKAKRRAKNKAARKQRCA